MMANKSDVCFFFYYVFVVVVVCFVFSKKNVQFSHLRVSTAREEADAIKGCESRGGKERDGYRS